MDKFVSDSVLSQPLCEVSHKCHQAWCFVASHLELVTTRYNYNHSKCKNGSTRHHGGCNALDSAHPYDPCLLNTDFGTPFDTDNVAPSEDLDLAEPHDIEPKPTITLRLR